jgi:hypothetical protein
MRRAILLVMATLVATAGCRGLPGTRSLPSSRAGALAIATNGQPVPHVVGMPPAQAANAFAPTRIDGAIVRSQLQSLIGQEPAEAKKKLRGYGHDGEVKVEPGRHFYEGCGENRVCGFNVPESGMGVHDPIILYVNPGLNIAAPPPE